MPPTGSEVSYRFCSGFGVAPFGLLGAVTPVARPVEDQAAELVHALHLAHPIRMRPVVMVVGRLGDIGHPQLAVESLGRNPPGAIPGVRLLDRFRLAVTGEGELAGKMPAGVLIDDAAN